MEVEAELQQEIITRATEYLSSLARQRSCAGVAGFAYDSPGEHLMENTYGLALF